MAAETAPAPLLRVAFVGKGGSGKSMISGTIVRLLGAAGEPVLALDSDPLPGLAFSVGIPQHDAGLPEEAVVERPEGEDGPRFRLAEDAVTLAERHARVGPDGVRFLQIGKAGSRAGGNQGRSLHAFRHVAAGLDDGPWHLVGDLPGGTRQPFFGWARWARLVLVVVEPVSASILTGRRLARLGQVEGGPRVVAVASKVDGPADTELVAGRTGLPVIAAVPHDPAVAAAERLGSAPLDHDPDAPAVQAVRSLLVSLRSAGGVA
ncbi:MAG: hypothetical protein H0V93_12495 [Euzebyales bacterium]|nr:hypothetical protein [Euzebyales bacterium]